MKIILVAGRHGRSRDVALGRWARTVLSFVLLGLPLGTGLALGFGWGQTAAESHEGEELRLLRERLQAQNLELIRVRRQSAQQLDAMVARAADLQVRLMRLDNIGQRMVAAADLDNREFDFSTPPGVGGPMVPAPAIEGRRDVLAILDELVDQIEGREQQFDLMQELMANARVDQSLALSGRPVREGYISSSFGLRSDPFHGKRAMHQGLDFVAREGSDVLAVAAGVVLNAKPHGAYGNLVEVEHSDGYVTRYAHNKKLLVKPGDLVKKGQVIALLGSTGRSTAPHVHFEVRHNGRPVDPARYLKQASR